MYRPVLHGQCVHLSLQGTEALTDFSERKLLSITDTIVNFYVFFFFQEKLSTEAYMCLLYMSLQKVLERLFQYPLL